MTGESFEITAGARGDRHGGFQANLERLRERISPAPERLVQRNARTGVGDGPRMAEEAGAARRTAAASTATCNRAARATTRPAVALPRADELAARVRRGRQRGRRVADEGWGGIYLANRIAALPDPASTW